MAPLFESDRHSGAQSLWWEHRPHYLYSRFADDFIFATKAMPLGKRRRRQIRSIISDAGFEISPHKTRQYDLERSPITLNGVGLRRTSHGTRAYMPRSQLNRLHGMLYAQLNGQVVNLDQLNGLVGWFTSVTELERPNRSEARVIDLAVAYKPTLMNPATQSRSRLSWVKAHDVALNGWSFGRNGNELDF